MPKKDPDVILDLLKRNWTGNPRDLQEALELFYQDIRSSVEIAFTDITEEDQLRRRLFEIDDYVQNHYF